MENCKHVKKLAVSHNHSILNPQKWLCLVCGTTESVWACLSCANVACGRYNEEHALQHFKESKHCLAIEVNERYVFCYECDDYVLNDNNAGDLKIIRSCLSAVATQSLDELRQLKSHRLLRSQSARQLIELQKEERLKEEDRAYTVLRFRRYYLLLRNFLAWKSEVAAAKIKKKLNVIEKQVENTPANAPANVVNSNNVQLQRISRSQSAVMPFKKKSVITPGVIGLRNLGNTCYMNSILQVLSQVREFRDFVLYRLPSVPFASGENSSPSCPSWVDEHVHYSKQTSVDLYTHINSGGGVYRASGPNGSSSKKGGSGGLNGGGTRITSDTQSAVEVVSAIADSESWSLGHELYALFRVMWSGKWALVSPHKMLSAVWKAISYFKGYTQHDAQEFLCEFLDKLQSQLDGMKLFAQLDCDHLPKTVTEIFEGSLVSEVKCLTCDTRTAREEAFMDLSLEFPSRYQVPSGSSMFVDCQPCSIEEMLFNFTGVEKLEGRIYACEACNNSRRRASRHTILCEAEKRLRIKMLPRTLRLHLKRFMWSGRNNRCKISSHVDFGEYLNLSPFCQQSDTSSEEIKYRLTAVVIHHGRGFGSGHYTSYCWNSDAGFWMHCNDAAVDVASLNDVLKAQAYILFYTQIDGKASYEASAPQRQPFVSADCNLSPINYDFKAGAYITGCTSDPDMNIVSVGDMLNTAVKLEIEDVVLSSACNFNVAQNNVLTKLDNETVANNVNDSSHRGGRLQVRNSMKRTNSRGQTKETSKQPSVSTKRRRNSFS